MWYTVQGESEWDRGREGVVDQYEKVGESWSGYKKVVTDSLFGIKALLMTMILSLVYAYDFIHKFMHTFL